MLRERMIGEHYLDFDHNEWIFGIRPTFKPINNDVKEKISDNQLNYPKEIYKNIFFQAFKLRKDIFPALKVAECKCLNNLNESSLNPMEKGMVFLKILADEMGCSVANFFDPTEETRRNEVYHWLCNMPKMLRNMIQIHEYVGKQPYDSEVKTFKRFSFNEWVMTGNDWLDVYKVDVHMDFFIDKIEYSNGEVWYVMKSAFLYYGLQKERLPEVYTYEGAEIYAEQQGYLASWFETIYKEYIESPWPKDFYRYGQEQ